MTTIELGHVRQLVAVFGSAMLTIMCLILVLVIMNRCTLQDSQRKTETMWGQRMRGITNDQLPAEERKSLR